MVGPHFVCSGLSVVIRLPLVSRGLRLDSRHVAAVALRRVQRVASEVMLADGAELAEEAAEEVSLWMLDVCLVAALLLMCVVMTSRAVKNGLVIYKHK